MPDRLLPVHGFVLAGGKSSRMGRDKALLPFRGRSMVEIAVEKLRGFCSAVSIAGNREDLSGFAPVVMEQRVECGPAAGIEAGLMACSQPWAMFVPVDVPLVPGELLKRWAEEVLTQSERGPLVVDHLFEAIDQPAFCMMKGDRVYRVKELLDDGERRLLRFLPKLAGGDEYTWHTDVHELYGLNELKFEAVARWFTNVNTQSELEEAETWAASCSGDFPSAGVRDQRTSGPLRG